MPTVPSTGWGVLHLFFHFRRAALSDPVHAAGEFIRRVSDLDGREDYQVLTFSVLGQKADLGLMVLGPDLDVLDSFAVELVNGGLGEGLVPAASYLSLTETSEYTTTPEQERERLVAEEDLAPDSEELEEQVRAFEQRMAAYAEHRLHPNLPRTKVIGFYPMSKRREVGANWYALDFAERKRIMAGHAAVGRTYRGRVTQLITGSTGLDDWEWGVTLLTDDPATLKEIVHEMRFDEASAAYADFGPFVTGLAMEPAALMRRLGLQA
ncbi:chlorite dismutase family protein [Euzebya tangerina]|uniref:chlorite dismutase family protein n=1 Tax=Euzebya tangerina TaxID=591198 RepID=UPI000E319EAF|nr:chlorite dismutase family protein [Euzebya tangerina]